MRDKIKLVSSAGTGHYYTATKNKRLHPEKLETKKYDPTIRKHVIYKEAKIKSCRSPPCGRSRCGSELARDSRQQAASHNKKARLTRAFLFIPLPVALVAPAVSTWRS